MPTHPSRILLVDDHPVVLFGLRLMLDALPQFEVGGEATDIASATALTAACRPDFIILDLVLGGRDGIELIGELLKIHPETQILVYSSHDEGHFARRVLRAGGRGYVSKSQSLSVVADALRTVAAGEIFVSAAVQRMLLNEFARGASPEDGLESLSNRELQVLRMIGTGFSSQEIAVELSLSSKTVGTYRERIKMKLGLDGARALEQAAVTFARVGRLS